MCDHRWPQMGSNESISTFLQGQVLHPKKETNEIVKMVHPVSTIKGHEMGMSFYIRQIEPKSYVISNYMKKIRKTH